MSNPSFHENQHMQQQRLRRSQETRTRPTIGRSVVQTEQETKEYLPVLHVVSKPNTATSNKYNSRSLNDTSLIEGGESIEPSIPGPSFRAHKGRLQEQIENAGLVQFHRHQTRFSIQYPYADAYFPLEQSTTPLAGEHHATPFLTEAADGDTAVKIVKDFYIVLLGHACTDAPGAQHNVGILKTHHQFPRTVLPCGHDMMSHYMHLQLKQSGAITQMISRGYQEVEDRQGCWVGQHPTRFHGQQAQPVCVGVNSGDEAYVQLELQRAQLVKQHQRAWAGHVAQWQQRVEEVYKEHLEQDELEAKAEVSEGKFQFLQEPEHQLDTSVTRRPFPAFPALCPVRLGISWAAKVNFRTEDQVETYLAERKLERAGVETKKKEDNIPSIQWSGQTKTSTHTTTNNSTNRSLLGNLELKSRDANLHFSKEDIESAAQQALHLWRVGQKESEEDDLLIPLPSARASSPVKGHASVDALLGEKRVLPPEVPAWLLHRVSEIDASLLSVSATHVQSTCKQLESELRATVHSSSGDGQLVAIIVSAPVVWRSLPFSLASLPLQIQETVRTYEMPVAVPIGTLISKIDAQQQAYYACKQFDQKEDDEIASKSEIEASEAVLLEENPQIVESPVITMPASRPSSSTQRPVSSTQRRSSRYDQRSLQTKSNEAAVVEGNGVFATTVRDAQREVESVGQRQAERTLQLDTHEATSKLVQCEQALLSASNAAAKTVLLQVVSGLRELLHPLHRKISELYLIQAPMPEQPSLCKLVWHMLGLCLRWDPGMSIHRAIVQYEPQLAISDGITISGVKSSALSDKRNPSTPTNTQQAQAQLMYEAYNEANQPAARVLASMGGALLQNTNNTVDRTRPQQDVLVSQMERFNPASLRTEAVVEIMNILANPSLRFETVTALHPQSGVILQWVHTAISSYQQWAGAQSQLIKQTRRAVAEFERITANLVSEELMGKDVDLLQRHLHDPDPVLTKATEETLSNALKRAAAMLPKPVQSVKPLSPQDPLTQARVDHFLLAKQRERHLALKRTK